MGQAPDEGQHHRGGARVTENATPPLRLINLWRKIIWDGEIYRSPGRALWDESVRWGVRLQREYPLHEGPFWYFLTEGHAAIARGYVEAYDAAHPEAAERAAKARRRQHAKWAATGRVR
jgi:hypothetical protein